MRIRTLLENKLPYDAEIEYLGVSIGQRVNTGIYATGDTYVKIEGYDWDANRGEVFFMVRNNSREDEYGEIAVGHVSYIENYYGNDSSLGIQNSFFGSSNFIIEKNKNVTTYYNLDTHETRSCSRNYAVFSNPYIIYLFATNNKGVLSDGCNFKFRNAVIKNNDTLVRDFIPVRVGNVGYMYDKVSGQLFGNSGTGSFILGPDK